MALAEFIDQFVPIGFSMFVTYAGVFALVSGLVFTNYDRLARVIGGKYRSQRDWIVSNAYRLFIEYKSETVMKFLVIGTAFMFLCAFIFCYPYLIFGIPLGVLFTVVFLLVPISILRQMRTKRIALFTLQLIDALSLMANALRSGLNIPQALQLVSEEMPNPVAQEFGLVLREQKVGVPLEEAIAHISERLPSPDVEMFTTSVNILRETGGNLAETFESITYTIRERNKLEQKISAMVAQGVVQGVIMVLLPFGLAIVMYMINPGQVTLLFTTPVGWAIVGAMMFLQSLGGFAIWKIINVRV